MGCPSAPAARAWSTFSSALAPKPGTSLQPAVLGRLAQVVEGLDPQLLVQDPGALGAEPGYAGDLDQASRDLRLELLGGGDRARLEQHVDLLRDRLPHPRELLDAALLRKLGHRHPRVADGLGGVAVRQHAIDDRAVELVQGAELLEGVCDL